MIDTLSRREFLKTGLAATAAAVVGPRLARADHHLLFEKTWIRSLKLSNRAIRSSTWSGAEDRKGYVTDRALEFYGELAKGDIGLILKGPRYNCWGHTVSAHNRRGPEAGQSHEIFTV